MKERPIIFSGEMVRAILEGRKTQTRRALKGRPYRWWAACGWPIEDGDCLLADAYGDFHSLTELCPYGRIGDRLWVREAWARQDHDVTFTPSYRADGGSPHPFDQSVKWRPSIHMPRWASRILLEVTDVRVERVQDISEADVQAEGCTGSPFGPMGDAVLFPILWDSINAKRGHGWDSNPWVWVVSFRVLEKG